MRYNVKHVEPPPGWVDLTDDWLRYLTALGRADATLDARRYGLIRAAKVFGCLPSEVSNEHVIDYLAMPGARETRRERLSTCSSFFKWAVNHGRLQNDPTSGIPPLPRLQENLPPAPESAIDLGLASRDPDGHLMVGLAAEGGLRRFEIARARTQDLTLLLSGWGLVVHGKGKKTRTVPLPSSIAAEILARPEGFLFPGRFSGHVDVSTVERWITRATGGYSPHSLRRRYGTQLYRECQDILVVMYCLGHASPATTSRYIGIPLQDMSSAVESLHRRRYQGDLLYDDNLVHTRAKEVESSPLW